MTDNNKHLVRAGHEFAAAMTSDTPIITIAKMVTELASALDVQSARSDALAAERDAVNADNAYLRDQVLCWARECDRITYTYTNKVTDAHQSEAEQELANTLPATDAWVNEQRAVAYNDLCAAFVMHRTTAGLDDSDKVTVKEATDALLHCAAQLRGSQV